MALIFTGRTLCALCDKVISSGDEIVGTSAFIADKDDPLWKYSDAAFHKTCFISWEKRGEFVSKFNRTMERFVFGDGKYHQMLDDGSIISVAKKT